MDVIELDGIPDIYRLVPQEGQVLSPIKINDAEKSKKLVKVTSKTTIRNGKTQIGFHDGRSLISDTAVNVGDSCLMQVPEQKILDVIKLEKNSQVIVTRGANAGQIGLVEDIKEGTFILPKRVLVVLGERKIEIPTSLVMVIGKDKPIIQMR
jgi:small subunit ribosomal protein S4e